MAIQIYLLLSDMLFGTVKWISYLNIIQTVLFFIVFTAMYAQLYSLLNKYHRFEFDKQQKHMWNFYILVGVNYVFKSME